MSEKINYNSKILVVDDFSTMRRIIKNILKELGYSELLEAENGQEALSVYNSHPDIALILSDWNMPIMQGIDFLIELRKKSNVPVIMVTAESKREQIIDAAKAGVNGYVIKPFTANTLKEKIDKVKERL